MNIRIVKNFVEMASGYHDAILYSGNFLHLNHDQYVDIVVDSKYTENTTTLLYTDIYGVVHTLDAGISGEYYYRLTDVTLNNLAIVHADVTPEDVQLIEDDPEILINTVLTGMPQGLSFDPAKIITMHPCNEGIIGGFALTEVVTGTSAIIQGYTEECRTGQVIGNEGVMEDIQHREYGIQNLLFSIDPNGVIEGFSTIDELDFKNVEGYIDSRWVPLVDEYTILEDGDSGKRAMVYMPDSILHYMNGDYTHTSPLAPITESLKIRNIPIDGSDNNDKTKTKVRIYDRALTAGEISREYIDSLGRDVTVFMTIVTDREIPPNILTSMIGAEIYIEKNEGEMSYDVWSHDPLPDISVRNPNTGKVLSVDVKTLGPSIVSMRSMFECCDAAVTIDLEKISTPNVTDMSNMFKGCMALKYIPLSQDFTTHKVVNMRAMFLGCKSLEDVSFQSFNTSAVLDMSHMFRDAKVSMIDPSIFNTMSVTTMAYMYAGSDTFVTHLHVYNLSSVITLESMYEGCTNIATMGTVDGTAAHLSTGLITVSKMFKGCSALKDLEFKFLYTANVTNFSEMFYGCISLGYIEFDGVLITSSATTMRGMFEYCTSMSFVDLPSFSTANVTDFSRMFSWCTSLNILSFVHMKTPAATDMSYMFYMCGSLIEFNATVDFDTSLVTDYTSMFEGCTILSNIGNPGFDSIADAVHSRMFTGAAALNCITQVDTVATASTSDMFVGCDMLMAPNTTDQALILDGYDWVNPDVCVSTTSGFSMLLRTTGIPTFSAVGGELTVVPFTPDAIANTLVGEATGAETYWYVYSDDPIESVYVDKTNNAGVILSARVLSASSLTSIADMFYNCVNLTHVSLDGITSLAIEDASRAYHNCTSLVEVTTPPTRDLFVNTTDMSRMFYGCVQLEVVPLIGPTPMVVDTSFMFSECRKLTVVDLRDSSLDSLSLMDGMFEGCLNLMYIEFDLNTTIYVLEANSLFARCESLKNLPIGSLDFSLVTSFDHFVYGCSSLECMGDLDSSSIITGYHMFEGCESLIAPNLTEQADILAGIPWDNPIDCIESTALYHVVVKSATRPVPVGFDVDMNVIEGAFAVLPLIALDSWEILSNKDEIHFHALSASLFGPNVITDVDVINMDNVVSTSLMLLNAHTLSSIQFSAGCATTLLTDTSCMFADKSILEGVSFANFDTSRVTNMSKMFAYPSGTPGIMNAYADDLDTSAVTDMSYMFYGADTSKMAVSDFSGLGTTNVETMYRMFAFSKAANSTFDQLELGVNLKTTEEMFAYSSVQAVDLADAATLVLENMDRMFHACSDLTQVNIDASMLNSPSLITVDGMFDGCILMEFVHLPEFTGTNVTNIGRMFKNCHTLNRIDVPDGYPAFTTNADELFSGCSSMTSIFNTPVNSVLTGMVDMFKDCTALECIYDLDTLTDLGPSSTAGMFANTPELVQPDASTQIDLEFGSEWLIDPSECTKPGSFLTFYNLPVVDDDYTFIWNSSQVNTDYFELYKDDVLMVSNIPIGNKAFDNISHVMSPGIPGKFFVRAVNSNDVGNYVDSDVITIGDISKWRITTTLIDSGVSGGDVPAIEAGIVAEFGEGAIAMDWSELLTYHSTFGHLNPIRDMYNAAPTPLGRPMGGVSYRDEISPAGYPGIGYFVEEEAKYFDPGFTASGTIGPGEGPHGGDLLNLAYWDEASEYYVKLP